MAVGACKECGREVSDQATACPHCGHPTRVVSAMAPSAGSGSTIPGAARAACVLWIMYGSVGVLAGIMTAQISPPAAGPQILFGLAFLITGIQVWLGKAAQILGSGIACIVLGAIGLLLLWMMGGVLGGGVLRVPTWVTSLAMFNNLLLIVAGILAIVGSSPYKQWVASKTRRSA